MLEIAQAEFVDEALKGIRESLIDVFDGLFENYWGTIEVPWINRPGAFWIGSKESEVGILVEGQSRMEGGPAFLSLDEAECYISDISTDDEIDAMIARLQSIKENRK